MGVTIYLVTGDDPPSSWKIFANPILKKIGYQSAKVDQFLPGGDPNHLQPPVGPVGWSILPAGDSGPRRPPGVGTLVSGRVELPSTIVGELESGRRVGRLVVGSLLKQCFLRRWLDLFWGGRQPSFSMFRMFNGLFLLVENGSNLKSRTCLKD